MKNLLLSTLVILFTFSAFAQKLPFQGKLIQDGIAVDSTLTFEFSIQDLEWNETHSDVTVIDGLYFVVLGTINPLPDSLFYGVDERNLAISVDGTALSPVVLFKPLTPTFEGGELSVKNEDGKVVGKLFSDMGHGTLQLSGDSGLVIDAKSVINGPRVEGHLDFYALKNKPLSMFARTYTDVGSNGAYFSGMSLLEGDTNGWLHRLFLRPTLFALSYNRSTVLKLRVNDGVGGFASSIELNAANNKKNIYLGSRYTENANLPVINLFGSKNSTDDFNAMELTVSGDSIQYGIINLMSKDGKSMSLRPDGFNTNRTHIGNVNDGNGTSSELLLNGENSPNIQMGGQPWGNSDLGFFQLFTDKPDGNGYHAGARLYVDTNGINSWGNMEFFNNGEEKISLNGNTGDINIAGTLKIGKNDFNAIELTVSEDSIRYGVINLMSQDGKSLSLSPDGFNTNKTNIRNVNDGNGTSSELFLYGENSFNIQMGGQPWENSDLGFLTVFTDKADGNGWYYGGATISAATDGPNSWGIMSLANNGEEKILLNGNTGDINIAGTLNQSSDRRLKKDVVKLTSSLNNLSRLQGISYYWKSDTLNTKPQIGLIAQDVEKVYPELVVTKDDGFKALNYSQMVAVLIEATKELNVKVESLETENNQLKAELSTATTNTSEIGQLKEQLELLTKMVLAGQPNEVAKIEASTSTPDFK